MTNFNNHNSPFQNLEHYEQSHCSYTKNENNVTSLVEFPFVKYVSNKSQRFGVRFWKYNLECIRFWNGEFYDHSIQW